jgi:hypothetical protein
VGKVWMDVYVQDGDVLCDWNQYIFMTDNSSDVARSEFQDDVNNFELLSSLAVQKLQEENIIRQDENGKWFNA